SSDTWFALYEDLLLPLAADEPAVVSAFAEVAYETSRFDRCVTALRDLGDRRRPDDDLRLLLASLRSGTPIELESVLERLDFSSNKDFEALLKILDEVDSSMLQELTVALSDNVLGEDKLLRFLDKTFI